MSHKRKFRGYEQREASPMSNKRSKCKSPQRESIDHTGDTVAPAEAASSGSGLQASSSGFAPPLETNQAPVTTANPRQAFPRDGESLVGKRKLKPKRRDERKRRLEWREEVKTFPTSRPDILHDHEIHLTPPPPEGERLPEDHGSGRAPAGAPCVTATSPASLGSHLAATGTQLSATRTSQTQEGRLSLGSATPSLAHPTFGSGGSHSPWTASSASPYSSALTPTEVDAITVRAVSQRPDTAWTPSLNTSSAGSISPPLTLATMSEPTNGISPLSDPYNGSLFSLEHSQAAYARFLAQFEDQDAHLRRMRTFCTTDSPVTVPQPSAAAISDVHPHGAVGGAAAYYRHRLELAMSLPPRPSTRRAGTRSIAANFVAPTPPAFHPPAAPQWRSGGYSFSEMMWPADFRNWDAPLGNVAFASTADDGSSTRISTAASDTSNPSSYRTYAASAVLELGYGPTNRVAGWRTEGTLATGQSAMSPSDMPPRPMSRPPSAGGSQGHRQRGQTESSLAHWSLP